MTRLILAAFAAALLCTPVQAGWLQKRLRARMDKKAAEGVTRLSASDPVTLSSGNYLLTMKFDSTDRVYMVHVPPSYDGKTPTPLVLNFHGGGGRWYGARNSSHLDQKADAETFIAVYPNSGNNYRWNVGMRTDTDRVSNENDTGFVNAMLDDLQARLAIDKKRIYATGLSNGGMMTYRAACEMSDRIAAFAPIGTTMMAHPCAPKRAVSVMHFHGAQDRLIPLAGGDNDQTLPKTMRLHNIRPVQKSVDFWVEHNNCGPEPTVTFNKGETVCKTWSKCDSGNEVVFCLSQNGGHSWPGGEHGFNYKKFLDYVGPVTHDISATDAMWDFFKRHPLP